MDQLYDEAPLPPAAIVDAVLPYTPPLPSVGTSTEHLERALESRTRNLSIRYIVRDGLHGCMSATGEDPSLTGDVVTVPFGFSEYLSTIRSEYEKLTATHGPDRVLILNRYPSGTRELEDALAETAHTIERPRIEILSGHATRVVEELETAPWAFDRDKRSVLVREFLDRHEWETEYLKTAADRDGFQADFLRFVVTASYQQRPASIDDQVLSDLYDAVAAYHTFCRETLPDEYDRDRGFIDRANIIVMAIDLLEDPQIGPTVRDDFDAVLALEFEEFDPTSREYLARLTRDRELVGIARADSAVRRPFSEAGQITDVVHSMRHRTGGSAAVANPLQALSTYLGTGDAPAPDLSKVAFRINAETFRTHVRAIAREIDRLHRGNGAACPHRESVAYDDIAVVLRDSNAPIAETNDILRAQGLPTTSATVHGLEHDPASRELLAVARWLAAECDGAAIDGDRAYGTLVSRVAQTRDETAARETIDEALAAAADAQDVHAGLWSWIVHSDLKARIATRADPIEARIQYDHVSDLVSLVEFIADEVVQGDWVRVVEEFENCFESETVDRVSEDLDTTDGAIRVDAARTVKTLDFDVVFLVGVVEGEYPTDPGFGAIFPEARLRRLDAYPTVTTPTMRDVRDTFGPATVDGSGRESRDALDAYYGEISRRMLAIGARAAQEGVYFCTYRQERGLGQRRRPSRFLLELEEHFGPLPKVDTTAHREEDPEAFALSQVEEAIDRVRHGAIRDEPVDLDRIKQESGAVQTILERIDDPALRRALEARVDFARGRVRRE